MTTTDGEAGGHAFPYAIHEGMTLRDYFAGQVLAGQSAFQGIGATDIALAAYEIAEAMLEARKR